MAGPKSSRSLVKWVSVALAVASAVLLLIASACGGGSESATTPSSGSPAASVAASPAASPAATNANNLTAVPSSSGSAQTSGAAAKKLKDLSGQWVKTNSKITYDMTTNTAQGTQTGTAVMYWAPPKFRMDMDINVGGITTKVTIISTGDKNYSCIQQPTPQCIEGSAGSLMPQITDPTALEKTVNDFAGSGNLETSSQKIAGKDATCFSTNTGKWCFSNDGLLLLANVNDTSGNTTLSLQAKDVGNVSNSDFDPPYPVSQLPAGIPTP